MQQLQERLLVILPLEPVFGVANLKTIKGYLSDEPLPAKGVGSAENVIGAVRLIPTAFDEALSTKQRKTSCCFASYFAECRETCRFKSTAEIKTEFAVPASRLFLQILLVGIYKNVWQFVAEVLTVKP